MVGSKFNAFSKGVEGGGSCGRGEGEESLLWKAYRSPFELHLAASKQGLYCSMDRVFLEKKFKRNKDHKVQTKPS